MCFVLSDSEIRALVKWVVVRRGEERRGEGDRLVHQNRMGSFLLLSPHKNPSFPFEHTVYVCMCVYYVCTVLSHRLLSVSANTCHCQWERERERQTHMCSCVGYVSNPCINVADNPSKKGHFQRIRNCLVQGINRFWTNLVLFTQLLLRKKAKVSKMLSSPFEVSWRASKCGGDTITEGRRRRKKLFCRCFVSCADVGANEWVDKRWTKRERKRKYPIIQYRKK